MDRKHGQGTHCTKMGADSLVKIPQMPQNLSAQFVCPSPKVWDFRKKLSLGVHSPCKYPKCMQCLFVVMTGASKICISKLFY